LFFLFKYIIFTSSFRRFEQGNLNTKERQKMKRHSIYPSSVSPVTCGFSEFGMILAERVRERERNMRICFKKVFSQFISSRNFFSAILMYGTMVGRNTRSAVVPFFYSFRFIPTGFFTRLFAPEVVCRCSRSQPMHTKRQACTGRNSKDSDIDRHQQKHVIVRLRRSYIRGISRFFNRH
jgi:hypothetical protein